MTDESLLPRPGAAAQHFRRHAQARLAQHAYREAYSDRYELVIPAAHPAVGDLRVRDDDDELTVSIGELHHWHVSLLDFENEPEERQAELVADTAVGEILDFLEHRTVLRVNRRGGQIRSSMIYTLNDSHVPPPAPEDREFVWSGPRG